MINKANLNCFIFKFGFVWLGWVLSHQEPVTLYADNKPCIKVEPEMNIKYLTVGFTKKWVEKRVRKWCLKEVKEDD